MYDVALAAILVPHGGTVLLVNTGVNWHVEVDGFAFLVLYVLAGYRPLAQAIEQLVHLGVVESIVGVYVGKEVAVAHNVVVDFHLKTAVADTAHVHQLAGEAGGIGKGYSHEHVLGLAVVPVEVDVQALKEYGCEAHVGLDLFFPAQLSVARAAYYPAALAVVLCSTGGADAVVVTHFRVTRSTYAHLELQVAQPVLGRRHESFVGNAPHGTAAQEVGSAVIGTEA